MFERIKTARFPIEDASGWVSRTRDGGTIQVKMPGFWVLFFIRLKPY